MEIIWHKGKDDKREIENYESVENRRTKKTGEYKNDHQRYYMNKKIERGRGGEKK